MRVFLFLLLVLFAPPVLAGGPQLGFSERQRPDGLGFDYLFSDTGRGEPRHLAFVLPTATVRGGAGSYGIAGHYDPAAVTARVRAAVEPAARALGDDVQAAVKASRGGYELSVRVTGRRPRLGEVMAELKRVAAKAEADYLAEVYLRPLRVREVVPDYGRLAARFVEPVRPVAEALAAALPATAAERERLALALAFIQSIPYDTETAARRENGYVVPPMMLVQNKGACDSKSVTLASLLGTLLPGRPAAVILVPEHAFLGVALPALPGERTLDFEGRTYVLMEPVGPAQLPVGRLSDHSTRDLARLSGVTVLPVPPSP
ncbi:MAG: hypothetical protein WCO00_11595 [Rhodospirillaceae bacterium]